MQNDIFIALLHNAALLLVPAVIYDLVLVRGRNKKSLFRQILTGIALGGVGIGLLLASLRLYSGIIFDTRSVLLAVSGLFFGFTPTVIAMAMTAAFRFTQGGVATWPGIAVIFATGSMGLVWRRLRRNRIGEPTMQDLYVFGVLVHIGMLAIMCTLPPEIARRVLACIGLPVMLIYPLLTVALGSLLADRFRRERTATALEESEATYRTLFQNDHMVMLLINPETGTIADANPAACRFYGWTADELRQRTLSQINASAENKTAPISQQQKTGLQHRLANGSTRDVEMLNSPVTMGGRKLLFTVIQDITERNREEALRKQMLAEAEQARQTLLSVVEDQQRTEAKLQLTQFAIDHSSDPAYWIRSDGRFAYVNDAACQTLGYTKEKLLSLTAQEINPDLSGAAWAPHWQEIKKARHKVFESRNQTRDGHIFPVEVHANFLDFKNTEYIYTNTHNITRRKRLQEALEKRIVALTRPLDTDQPVAFDELFNLEEFQRIQDGFAAATGVASILTLPDGTPITRMSNSTYLCKNLIRKTEKGCSNCFKSDAALGQYHPKGPIVQPCLSGGLWDAGVSITVGDRHIANWLIGQVRDETQTEEKMRLYAREIGVDEQIFIEAFRKVPSMSRVHFEEIAQSLFTLAGQLSTSAYQNIQQARFIAEEKKDKAELQRLSTAIEQSPEAVVITSPDGTIQYVNPAFKNITGYSGEEALGKNPRFLKSGQHGEPFYSSLWKTIQNGNIWAGRFINKRKNGELYTEEASISPVRDPSGTITGYVAVKRDITEELSKEEQFRQSQKMEAIGQLAGGVAHDFNNILQAILGFSEILLSKLKTETVEHRNVTEIQKAAKRAAELTRQLLAFSRKQPVNKNRIHLNAAVYDSEVLIKLLLGDDIKCRLHLDPELQDVYADHGQITQIIMNLAVNARDAMPDGGSLIISTQNVAFEPKDIIAIPEAKAGRFACLSVADTGFGMDQKVKEHLFEPFFTTKIVGQGTGLGLSVVYGIVKQNKGWIQVDSEDGRGSNFKIYLPLCGADTAPVRRPEKPPEKAQGQILLVEDDRETRELAFRILTEADYEIIEASSAEEALQLFAQAPQKFVMLFSDIKLPGKSGIELADTLRAINPSMPIVLYSGYRDQREKWLNLDSKGYQFIQKPFSIASLLATVHDAMKDQF
jgi:PAS domain S-box-containing protein